MELLRQTIEQWVAQAVSDPGAALWTTDSLLVLCSVTLAAAAYHACRRLVLPAILHFVKHTSVTWDDILLNAQTLRHICLVVPAVVVWGFLPGVFVRTPWLQEGLERLTAIYIAVATTQVLLSVVKSLTQLNTDAQSARHQYLHSFCGVLKIVVIFISGVCIVAIAIDRNPLSLLAGLGATSAVLMLIFKDTIMGLVAGVRLTSNNMLHKGDWITVPKAGLNGCVEEITLTTVTITPQTLVDDSFQNWNTMEQGDGRRVMRQVFVDFRSLFPTTGALREALRREGYVRDGLLTEEELATAGTNLTLFRRFADRFLAAHPAVNPAMLHMVRLLEATPTGLPVEFYFFVKDKQWKHYEMAQAEILEVLFAALPRFGLRIYQRDDFNPAAPCPGGPHPQPSPAG